MGGRNRDLEEFPAEMRHGRSFAEGSLNMCDRFSDHAHATNHMHNFRGFQTGNMVARAGPVDWAEITSVTSRSREVLIWPESLRCGIEKFGLESNPRVESDLRGGQLRGEPGPVRNTVLENRHDRFMVCLRRLGLARFLRPIGASGATRPGCYESTYAKFKRLAIMM